MTYELQRPIVSLFSHEYCPVCETTRQNNRYAVTGRILITLKSADVPAFRTWVQAVSACIDPVILKPHDYWQDQVGQIQWVSGAAFPTGSECKPLTDYLRMSTAPVPSLLRQGLSCLRSAEACGLSVNQIFYNPVSGQLMADTSPQVMTAITPALLVQSIGNSLPDLYRLLTGCRCQPAELIAAIEQWEQGATPYQTASAPGHNFHQAGYDVNSFYQQLREGVKSFLGIDPIAGQFSSGSLTPTHGAGAPGYQPRHEAPAQPAAPRSNGTFTWNPGTEKFNTQVQQPARPTVTPAQPARPAVTPAHPARPAVTPAQPARPAVTPAQPARPAVTPAQPARPAVTPAQPARPTVTPAQPARPAVTPAQPVKPAVTPAQPARPVVTHAQPARPVQQAAAAPAPAPQAPATPSPIASLGWQAKKEYSFRDLPEIGASCPAVSLSTSALVRFEQHSREEQPLLRIVKSVLEQQSDHPIEQTEGLCQLHDVKDFDKSFLIIRDHIASEDCLPVGHPTLLALGQREKLTIARNMALIFARLTGAGWLPTRIIESAMLVNPKTLQVVFPDGHLLCRGGDTPMLATLGYAPPECMGDQPAVTLPAVSYALAVWLYRLFVGGYPMEGKRTLAALAASGKTEEELAPRLYGKEALFCFGGSGDNSLDGLGPRYDGQTRRWHAAPEAMRVAWAKTFISGLHKSPEDRRTPEQWLEIIDGLLKA